MIDEFDTDQVRPRARGGVRATLTLTLPLTLTLTLTLTPNPTQDGEICVEEFSAIMKTTSLYD